jgi:hypothetical protein
MEPPKRLAKRQARRVTGTFRCDSECPLQRARVAGYTQTTNTALKDHVHFLHLTLMPVSGTSCVLQGEADSDAAPHTVTKGVYQCGGPPSPTTKFGTFTMERD